mgnify:CR=1 FL=1
MRDPAEWKRQMDNYIRARNCASCVAWVLAYVVWTAASVFLFFLFGGMISESLAYIFAALAVVATYRLMVILLYYFLLFILHIIIKTKYPPP